jgi:spore coat protein U-like protein
MRITIALLTAGATLAAFATAAFAATATGSFNSQLVLTAQCKVQTTNTLDFGAAGVLDAAINQTADFTVQCTNAQAYTISLNKGSGAGTTTTRTLDNGAAFVNYAMYKDSGHTSNWGDTGAEIMTGLTGNGAAQTYTVYGQVPAQTTPAAGTYTDTVTITVTYP